MTAEAKLYTGEWILKIEMSDMIRRMLDALNRAEHEH